LASTVYNIYVRSNCGDGSYSNWTAVVNFVTLPENLTVTGVIGTGNVNCYNANNTITVAGNGTTFEVQDGGSATFIAGQMILFLPGTSVHSGGYLLGKIAPNGPFCNPTLPIAAAEKSGQEEQFFTTGNASFTLYPNPTIGNFTLVQKGEEIYENAKVEVYNMNGKKVLSDNLTGRKQEFRFSGIPQGVYFVKVMAGGNVEAIKLVKM
jgi:hypothetical protein